MFKWSWGTTMIEMMRTFQLVAPKYSVHLTMDTNQQLKNILQELQRTEILKNGNDTRISSTKNFRKRKEFNKDAMRWA